MQCVLGCYSICNTREHLSAIDEYCAATVGCIQKCTDECISSLKYRTNKHNVPGWSDLVKDKYDVSRAAYVDWASVGKPRSGYLHQAMCRRRADILSMPCDTARLQKDSLELMLELAHWHVNKIQQHFGTGLKKLL